MSIERLEIGRAGIPNPQVIKPLNDLVFSALKGTDAEGHLRWAEVTATAESKSNESIFLAAQKSGLPTAFLDKAKAVIAPGGRSSSLTGRWIQPPRVLPISRFSLRKKTSRKKRNELIVRYELIS